MAELHSDIQWIVSEVVRRLEAIEASTNKTKEKATEPEHGTLRIEARVVSLEQVARRLNGIRRVEVEPGAVVTPAVHDLVREQGAVLARRSGDNGTRQTALVVAAVGTDIALDSLMQALHNEQCKFELLDAGELLAATEQLARAVTGGRKMGLLLTRETAAANCLANRHRGVRAAEGSTVEAVRMAIQSVGANLIIINPQDKTIAQWKQIVAAIVSAGPASCPEQFRAQLG